MLPRTARLAVLWLPLWACLACTAGGLAPRAARGTSWLFDTGFEGRKDWPSAVFHRSRSEIRGIYLSNLLRLAPGVVIRTPRGAGWGVYRELPEGGTCEVAVSLNGARMLRSMTGGDWTVDFLVRLEDLDGVELHVGQEGPVRDEEGCGELLLWSRTLAMAADVRFRGRVLGSVWGEGAEKVMRVRLDPGGQLTSLDENGDFVFSDVLPGFYQVLVQTSGGTVGRGSVRVFAHANSWIDVRIEPLWGQASDARPLWEVWNRAQNLEPLGRIDPLK